MNTRYHIEGMTCGGCVKAVTKALERAGIAADVDLASNTATLKQDADPEAVLRAVRAAGFDAQPVERA